MATVTNTNMNTKSLIDKTIELYGDLSYIFKLVQDNDLTGLTETVTVGTVLSWDNNIVFLDRTKIQPTADLSGPTVKTIRIREKQTLLDMSIQMYGTLEGVFNIIQRNTGIDNLNDLNIRNIEMVYTEQTFAVTEFFRKNEIFISTGASTEGDTTGRQFDESFDLSFL